MKQATNQRGLRDPIWQAFGAIISILALVVSVIIAYDIYRRTAQFSDLTVEKEYSFNPIYFSESTQGHIAMVINGVTVDSVYVYAAKLTNTGRNPIIPTDYIEALRVSTEKPWNILSVESGVVSASL